MVPGFLVTVVNNLPAMQVLQEIQAQSLGQENPLKEEMATHYKALPGESHGREVWQATVHGVACIRISTSMNSSNLISHST